MSYKMKRNKKTFDFGNKGDFDIKSKKSKNKRDYTSKTKDHEKYSDLEKHDDDRG